MQQLIMYWKNDNAEPAEPSVPEGLSLHSITELSHGVEMWLDVVQYGLSKGKMGEEYYRASMTDRANYDPRYCFLLLCGDEAVATITVIFNDESKDGYIHMVACKEAYRGRGIGTYMNSLAVYLLKLHGMQTAHLTTDDWRIPAIKSYLRAGLYPDLSTEDFKARWDALYKKL